MKRLYMDKLQLILDDLKENNIGFIDNDEMNKLYDYCGDTVYYDPDYYKMVTSKKGRDYVKIKER